MDDQILFLYAKGLTTREIVETFQEMYGAEVSTSLISRSRTRSSNRSLNGRIAHWMRSIRWSIWIALY